MNKKNCSQVLEDVARDGIPAGLDLTPQIIARVQKGKSVTMQPRIKAFVMTIVVVFVLAALLINVPLVAAAIQRWFGYAPGLGLVRNGQLRELVEPVSVTQNGFTLKVEKATLSSEKTVFTYSLETITPDMQVKEGDDVSPGCSKGEFFLPYMRLPDGRKLEGLEPYGITGSPYNTQMTLAPMPADVNEATLVFDCVFRTLPEKVPQHWEVPLRFVTASSALTVEPVLEVPTTTASSPLALKNVVSNNDGYILSGTMTFVPPQGYTVNEYDGFLQDAAITDANGQVVKFGQAPDDYMFDLIANNSNGPTLPADTYNWGCQVYGENIQWPLTMTVHSLTVSGPLLPQGEFQFDTGPDPQPGQVWELNQDVTLGSKSVHIVSVTLHREEFGVGYELTFVPDPTLDFSSKIQGYDSEGGGIIGMPGDATVSQALMYLDPGPRGLLTVLLNGHELSQLPGSWQATWQTPSTTTP